MFSLIKKIFGKPSSYPNSPALYVANQVGHSWLGFAAVSLSVWLWVLFFDEYPSQVAAFWFVSLTYLFVWEVGVQGWRGCDTIEDTVFTTIGASIWLFVDMSYVLDRIMAYIFMTLFALSFGVVKRVRRGRFE